MFPRLDKRDEDYLRDPFIKNVATFFSLFMPALCHGLFPT